MKKTCDFWLDFPIVYFLDLGVKDQKIEIVDS